MPALRLSSFIPGLTRRFTRSFLVAVALGSLTPWKAGMQANYTITLTPLNNVPVSSPMVLSVTGLPGTRRSCSSRQPLLRDRTRRQALLSSPQLPAIRILSTVLVRGSYRGTRLCWRLQGCHSSEFCFLVWVCENAFGRSPKQRGSASCLGWCVVASGCTDARALAISKNLVLRRARTPL